MRTIIDIPDEYLQTLALLCEKKSISRSEAIRQAIGAYLEECKVDLSDKAFGIWKNKPVDGVEYQSKMRDEWDDR